MEKLPGSGLHAVMSISCLTIEEGPKDSEESADDGLSPLMEGLLRASAAEPRSSSAADPTEEESAGRGHEELLPHVNG